MHLVKLTKGVVFGANMSKCISRSSTCPGTITTCLRSLPTTQWKPRDSLIYTHTPTSSRLDRHLALLDIARTKWRVLQELHLERRLERYYVPTCHLQSVSFEDAVGSYLRPYISTVKGCSYLRFALALMRDSPSSGLREGSTVQSEADTRREWAPHGPRNLLHPWSKRPLLSGIMDEAALQSRKLPA
jgi:hypothetical protein